VARVFISTRPSELKFAMNYFIRQHFITRESCLPPPKKKKKKGTQVTPKYSAKHGSLEVLEHILSHDACDVDPINTLGETPLHLALTSPELDPSPDDDDDSDEGGLREAVVDSLLDAGAAITYVTPHLPLFVCFGF
jgi:hypothetical protein